FPRTRQFLFGGNRPTDEDRFPAGCIAWACDTERPRNRNGCEMRQRCVAHLLAYIGVRCAAGGWLPQVIDSSGCLPEESNTDAVRPRLYRQAELGCAGITHLE